MVPWCGVVLVLLTWVAHVSSKAVFAHFMVGQPHSVNWKFTKIQQVTNTAKYERVTWSRDISLAKEAHIDAFALNLQYGDSYNEASVADAFYMAQAIGGFQLFFSFDYAGGGPWPKEDVISYLTKYSSSSAYFHHQGKPFVSTFEGPGSAGDWAEIKSRTGCYFVPDWSSLGAKDAAALAGGVADGLFSWAAWPWGNKDSDTYVDASYDQFLAGKPYMMAISPWFYTNLPGFNKNWLWRGDHLWFDRWQEAFFWQPEWIEIISWNDYGESHHIGPVLDFALDAFDIGNAPFNYVLDHDAWRDTLPFSIDLYKNNKTHVDTEVLVAWYRLNPKDACDSGGTTANTASQLQIEFPPSAIFEDSVIFSAILASDATVSVTIGGSPVTAKWTFKPEGGIGMYHGSAPFGGHTGAVQVGITRGGASIAQVEGASITTACNNGLANYNAWVGSGSSSSGVSADTPSLSDQKCINGTGAGNFQGLCEFACAYSYCPRGACLCTKMGKQRTMPKGTGVAGFPIAGEDESYGGLCGFSCGYGFCPSNACGTVKVPLTVATVSPFLPPACTAGEGTGQFEGLCKFSCDHGYCPMAVCTCTTYGVLNLLDPSTSSFAKAKDGDDHGLCAFACSRGYCPDSCSDPYADDEPPWPDWLDPTMIENDDWITDDSGVFCDPATKPGSLDELLGVLDPNKISPLCWNIFASDILQDMLDQALDDYQSVLDGYDGVFGYYVDWVKDSITPALRKYMDLDGGPGNAYFSCEWTWGTRSGSGACPPSEQFWKSTQEIQEWSVTYTLVDSNGFYDAISKDLGIDQKWVKFADDTTEYACADQGDTREYHASVSIQPWDEPP